MIRSTVFFGSKVLKKSINIKFKNLLSNPSIDSNAEKVFGIKFFTICLKTCSLHRYSPACVESLLRNVGRIKRRLWRVRG